MTLKVALIGSDQFGEQVFTRLLEGDQSKVQVIAVSAPENDKLHKAATESGKVKVFITSTLKDKADEWKALGADLGVMVFVTDIIPQSVLNAPRLGSIQYHPSLLPAHRGISSINWAVIKRDAETGYSIFWVDKYIDHGPILLQERFPIGPTDTVKTLYFNTLFPKGVDGMLRAVHTVAEQGEQAPRQAQDQRAATYEPPCKGEWARIAWHADAKDVYALIRGCDPQPGAHTVFGDSVLKIFDCELSDELNVGWPGKVTAVGDDGFSVRLNGGTLKVKRVQCAAFGGGKKIPAAQFAKEAELKVGHRFK